MGIDIDSKFLVGLWYEDFPEEVLEAADNYKEGPTEYFNDLGLSSASPHYDSGHYECFWGLEVMDNTNVWIVCEQLKTSANIFKEQFNCEPVVYAGCNVW